MSDTWNSLPQHPDRQPQSSSLRAKIIEAARSKLDVREKMTTTNGKLYGLNNDDAGWIKRFFMEGVGWKESEWQHWFGHPMDKDEPDAGAMWCAAFASWSVVQGHAAEGLPLPLKLHAHGNTLRDYLKKAGLFIPMAGLYAGGNPVATTRLPGPGDFIVFDTGHIGLVERFDHAGRSLDSIEGNTYVDPRNRQDGVYAIAGIKGKRFEKIQGFGIVDPVECPGTSCGWSGRAH